MKKVRKILQPSSFNIEVATSNIPRSRRLSVNSNSAVVVHTSSIGLLDESSNVASPLYDEIRPFSDYTV